MLNFDRVVAFADDVVLMKHVTEEMSVIELVDDRRRDVVRQGFEPVRIVAPERYVDRDDIFHLAAVHRAVAICGTGDGEAVQEGLFALLIRAFEERTLRRRKDGLEK